MNLDIFLGMNLLVIKSSNFLFLFFDFIFQCSTVTRIIFFFDKLLLKRKGKFLINFYFHVHLNILFPSSSGTTRTRR